MPRELSLVKLESALHLVERLRKQHPQCFSPALQRSCGQSPLGGKP